MKKASKAVKPETVAMASSATLAAGAKVFSTNCSSCHQAQGTGQPGVFPPLAKNPTVNGDATRLVHIVKYGLSGSVAVLGTTYNGMMPAWHSTLSDADIAAVLSYVRSSWGNKAAPISASQVAAVKQ
ncbi:MAG: c-type cytochrome [Vulcanimicrobiaceae bacterium]